MAMAQDLPHQRGNDDGAPLDGPRADAELSQSRGKLMEHLFISMVHVEPPHAPGLQRTRTTSISADS